ncbi:MAG: hypothetical protein U1F36_07335 [Planctomycetota bacterium]
MIDVAVLGGGASAEHEVSLRSCTAVLSGLDRARWRPWPVYVDRSGNWHLRARPLHGDEPPPNLDATLGCADYPGRALAVLLERGVGLVFPVMHGRSGEDGTLQGMLEQHRVAFVGSGTAASAVGMDKLRTRECLSAHGIPMAPARCGPLANAKVDEEAEAVLRDIGLPCFVKSDLSGSSFGVRRCSSRAELVAFFREESGRRYVAESPLSGEEISVPVLGNLGERLRPLLPVGIYPRAAEWFTPDAKYAVGGAEEVVPPRGLDAATISAVQSLAVRCHEAVGCDGVSRTDMIVTRDGPRVLEINTLPGLTTASLLPKCAAAEGISFGELMDLLLLAALRRAGRPTPDPLRT